MITTVIADNSNYINLENMYEGMNLAEATGQFDVDCINAINEFQMDILLQEHAYLYENGNEISYVDEAGNVTEHGKNLWDKVVNLVVFVADKVEKLLNTAMDAIQRAAEKVSQFFEKRGISKKIAKSAAGVYGRLISGGMESIEVTIPNYVSRDISDLINDTNKTWKTGITDRVYKTSDSLLDEYVSSSAKITVNSKILSNAIDIVYNTNTSYISKINKHKREIISGIKASIKDIKSHKNVDDSTKIEEYKKNINAVRDLAKAVIRIYHYKMANNIAIVRSIFSVAEVRKGMLGEAKEAVKKIPGEAKEAVKKIPGEAKDAADQAVGKAKKLFSKAKHESAYITEYAEEETVAESVYDGNYFRV